MCSISYLLLSTLSNYPIPILNIVFQDVSLKKKEEDRAKKPHIYNLNQDPMLSGNLVHILRPGTTKIGKNKTGQNTINILGPGSVYIIINGIIYYSCDLIYFISERIDNERE